VTGSHGLVIGKFYPPHAGHHYLIRTAAAACDRVSVIVMPASHESIPLGRRVEWLREVHADAPHVAVTGIVDDAPIDYADAAIWDQHVALMRRALAGLGAPRVTAIFASEPYCAELARRFGAEAILVDPARRQAPVSATRVRADPPATWQWLEPPVRGGLALRIAVVGAESSGTTTLASGLARHWRDRGGAHALTRWVPEYGRAYTARKLAAEGPAMADLVWRSAEFVHIARTQRGMEEREARLGGPLLVCDTDAFATAVWHERYVGEAPPDLQEIAAASRAALYLLTHHADVPFVADGLRDGEAIRPWMTARFLELLRATGRPHLVLRGDQEARLAQAVAASERLLAEGWKFAPPLG
jgi:NadR type nicotinamide-nucleotide adenylyltransferase